MSAALSRKKVELVFTVVRAQAISRGPPILHITRIIGIHVILYRYILYTHMDYYSLAASILLYYSHSLPFFLNLFTQNTIVTHF